MKAKIKASIVCLLFPVLVQGQEIGLLRLNPERPASQGMAALWGGVAEGGFRPAFDASFQWTAGAEAQGVRHGKNTSWTGALSFEQRTGYNMFSSLFLEPGYFPMDFLEFSPGTKSRQTGRLEGGFLTDIGREAAAGIKASFQVGHDAKQQAPSPVAFGMKLQVEPAFTYVMDDEVGLVSSYIFRLRTESLRGATDESAPVFMDKGLRYGSYQSWNGHFAVQELSHGFAELFQSPEFALGFGIVWKRGKAGNDGLGTFRFPGSTLSTFLEHTLLAEGADHIYRISYQRRRDQLREVTEGVLKPDSDRRDRILGLKYEVRFLDGILKRTSLSLDGSQSTERSALSIYDQTLRYNGTATLLASFSYGIVDLNLHVQAGKGWWKNRGFADATEQPEGDPLRLIDDWSRKMDYIMASRIGMGGSLTCRIPAVKGLFVQLDGFWHHGLNVTLLPGKNREIGTLKVGYRF